MCQVYSKDESFYFVQLDDTPLFLYTCKAVRNVSVYVLFLRFHIFLANSFLYFCKMSQMFKNVLANFVFLPQECSTCLILVI